MLTPKSYQGVVQNGVIHLRDVRLPEGAQVVVVVASALPAEEQARRLQADSLGERQRRFDTLVEQAEQYHAEIDIDAVDDEELAAIVHEVRAEKVRIKGIYDGQKVVLTEPVMLPANTAVEVVVADPLAEQEQAYWQRLVEQGLIKTVRTERWASRQAPAPAQVTGEPISETISAERR